MVASERALHWQKLCWKKNDVSEPARVVTSDLPHLLQMAVDIKLYSVCGLAVSLSGAFIGSILALASGWLSIRCFRHSFKFLYIQILA